MEAADRSSVGETRGVAATFVGLSSSPEDKELAEFMRRLLLHLSTALVAFALGLGTALIFGVFSFDSPRPEKRFDSTVYVEPPPAPRACPNAPKFSHELPVAPLAPLPPMAPPPPPEPLVKGTRVVIRRPDGTVQVIETEKRVEQKTKGS